MPVSGHVWPDKIALALAHIFWEQIQRNRTYCQKTGRGLWFCVAVAVAGGWGGGGGHRVCTQHVCVRARAWKWDPKRGASGWANPRSRLKTVVLRFVLGINQFNHPSLVLALPPPPRSCSRNSRRAGCKTKTQSSEALVEIGKVWAIFGGMVGDFPHTFHARARLRCRARGANMGLRRSFRVHAAGIPCADTAVLCAHAASWQKKTACRRFWWWLCLFLRDMSCSFRDVSGFGPLSNSAPCGPRTWHGLQECWEKDKLWVRPHCI